MRVAVIYRMISRFAAIIIRVGITVVFRVRAAFFAAVVVRMSIAVIFRVSRRRVLRRNSTEAIASRLASAAAYTVASTGASFFAVVDSTLTRTGLCVVALSDTVGPTGISGLCSARKS